MPVVEITMFKGRTEDKKRALIEEVSQAVAKVLSIPIEDVYVIIREIDYSDWGPHGKPYSGVRR